MLMASGAKLFYYAIRKFNTYAVPVKRVDISAKEALKNATKRTQTDCKDYREIAEAVRSWFHNHEELITININNTDMSPVVIHLRTETKPLERRSPLSPATAKALLDAGYTVRVEESPDRIYKIDEFRDVGAEIVPAGSWVNAPKEDIILGLKEIEANGKPLPHTYIHFAHVHKKQSGWATELSRFANADGLLYDLEFLTDEDGRRVAAFGYWAGYAGTALALLSWAHQLLNPGVPQGSVPVVDSASTLTELVKGKVDAARSANHGTLLRLIVIGALGRCGKGAIAAAEAIGVSDILKWDIAETSKGSNKILPFTTFEALSAPDRRLRVICDVSCDPNSENNPIAVYSSYSSFENPTVPASEHIDGPELRIIAIDHLPTMVARESSDEYSSLLLPSLLTLDRRDTEGVWQRAERIFRDRVAELP
ncbi:saccharopine dehydrogenase [Fusarium denticulatum]|uniref:Saccharopine dehydrogenase n=1 Tax=Fusarium denticulatum TaxID=48507 RepID=A0A8H5UH99_9HYPO|nr:saccharopine dehydrogenase [Fusarium denticulatum]